MLSRRLAAGLAAASTLLGAGCTSSKPDGKPSAPPTAVPTSASGTAAERDALAAYTGMWTAMARAGEIPDPDAPELRQYAADKALARIVSVLVTYRETDVVTKGGPITNARVTRTEPTEITIADCGDSTNWTKHKKGNGELIQDDPRGRRTITAAVKPQDGSWKVVSFDVGDIGSC